MVIRTVQTVGKRKEKRRGANKITKVGMKVLGGKYQNTSISVNGGGNKLNVVKRRNAFMQSYKRSNLIYAKTT